METATRTDTAGGEPAAVNFSAAFEQLAEGDSFVSRGRTVTEADVVAFAALTGDWHPQHADADWAKDSAFGERIAHGMLIVSFAVGLVPFDPDRVVALRRIGDAVFKRPVRFGDTIHVEGSVAELRDIDDGTGLVGWAWRSSTRTASSSAAPASRCSGAATTSP